jgi:hypothetical protein
MYLDFGPAFLRARRAKSGVEFFLAGVHHETNGFAYRRVISQRQRCICMRLAVVVPASDLH